MNSKLKEHILSGDFEAGAKMLKNEPQKAIEDFLLVLACETGSISVSSFVTYLFFKTKKICWLQLNIGLLLHALCHIEGAYPTAVFLLKKLIALEPKKEDLETLLIIFESPENTMTISDGLFYAKTLKKIDPFNCRADRILGQYEKK